MSEIQHAVMVYQHTETGEIKCMFWDDPQAREMIDQFRHIATLNPRLWIQANWGKVESHETLHDAIREAISVLRDSGYWYPHGMYIEQLQALLPRTDK